LNQISKEKLIEMYRTMQLIRQFEEKIVELVSLKGQSMPAHLYIGQETVAAGVCANLRRDDYITSTHRGHGHCIAKGTDIKYMMAELFQKKTGTNKGKGGSMHIAEIETGNLGANGIVGAGIPIATGAGLSIKIRGTDQVAVSFFGDGASNQGVFHESLNLASIWKLPVIYACENNQYAMSTAASKVISVENISERAKAYGIPGITVDSGDAIAVYEAAKEAVDRARKGLGPTLIEFKTYRFLGHEGVQEMEPYFIARYRPREEVEEWKKKDPVKRFKSKLIKEGFLTEEQIKNIEDKVRSEIENAVIFAEESPDPMPEDALKDLFVECDIPRKCAEKEKESAREITYVEAVREAITEEMRRDQKVFIMGEEIQFFSWGYRSLLEEFGEERVRSTPISEASFVGAGLGAALTGMRPIVEVMFVDLMGLTMDQVRNQIAKSTYMSGGKAKVPLIIRTYQGAAGLAAAHHSQSFEAAFTQIPGLKVVLPSNPYDAKGLMKTAIREDNPVIFLDHKRLQYVKGPVPKEEYFIPFGQACVKKEGEDVTIISWSYWVTKSLEAADKLEKEGISAEVIDLRTLVPFDCKTVLDSVEKTGRVVIVEEECKRGGAAAEVAAFIAEEAFDYLKAPIKRVAAKNVPMPYARIMETFVLPQEKDILDSVKEII